MIIIYLIVLWLYYQMWLGYVGPIVVIDDLLAFIIVYVSTNFIHREIMRAMISRQTEEEDEDLS